MSNTAQKVATMMPLPRKASKEVRRQQLIDATIETLARRGYAQLTLTDVAVTAGVSHGLVNFHFQSKERLLTETLLHLAAEYQQNWQDYLAAAGDDPACQIDALIRADLDPAVCTTTKLICWCAFWGESQSRPIYQKECGANDEAYIELLNDICRRLISVGGYSHDPMRAARMLRSLGDGVWQDIAFSTHAYAPEDGLKTMYLGAAALFPAHFSPRGLRRQ